MGILSYTYNAAKAAFRGKGKVSPTIKSVKPSTTVTKKGVKASLEKTRSEEYRKRYIALDKSDKKVETGKKMMREGQKERKRMVDTGRAFQFKHSKSYHAVKPGDKDQYRPQMKVAGPQKKFKTGKELEREKKMGGGMMGRRFGMKSGTPFKKETNVDKIKKTFAPKKKKFPDLTGDGKVTFADILKGRGVINGKKKKEGIMSRPGLYANIHAKRKRGGKMRKKGAKGAPKASDFKKSKTNSEIIMTKLCPRGKAAAKRKFKVYPSAYANAYASKICAGKIKDPSGVKRKDFRGSKAEGGLMEATARLKRQGLKSGSPMKEDRAREGKKAQYKKMGFGQLMKEGTIDFGDKNPILKKKKEKQKKYENPKKDERFNQAFKDRMKTMGLGNIAGDSRLAKGGRAGLKGGGICKRGMNRKAVGKEFLMAKNGLDKWFAQKWVDIGSKKKDGSFSKCGRSKQKKDAKRKYPKCVPLAKARRMTEGQRRSAVKRKRAVAQGVGGKPTNVKTFAKRKSAMMGGFMARRMGMR